MIKAFDREQVNLIIEQCHNLANQGLHDMVSWPEFKRLADQFVEDVKENKETTKDFQIHKFWREKVEAHLSN